MTFKALLKSISKICLIKMRNIAVSLPCKFASDEQNFAIITPTRESKVYHMQLFCNKRSLTYSHPDRLWRL